MLISNFQPFRLQVKAYYRQDIPESSCLRKKTVNIDILVTFRNSKKNHAITSRPSSRIRNKEPVEPVEMNIYQSNTYMLETFKQ